MKLLVIGQSVEDHIFYKGNETVKPGGLFYTASGLINIKDDTDEIFLITSIDENSYELFSSVFDKLNTTFCVKGRGIVPQVRLDIYDDRERDEKFNKLGDYLIIPAELPFTPDGILINMITGFDLNINQIEELRRKYNCPIYIDVHSLSRGVDASLHRPQQLIENFTMWAKNIDIIQVNDTEIFSLYDSNSEQEITGKVLSAGVKCLIVTKGNKGARIYYTFNNQILSVFYSAVKVNVRNTVGCGDIFGAVFFYTFIKFGDVIRSLALANKAAGMKSSYDKNDDLSKLKDDVFSRYN